MISFERVNPQDQVHMDRYDSMRNAASEVDEVRQGLPEIFEEATPGLIRQSIIESGAVRYFIHAGLLNDDGSSKVVGRIEFTRHLNDDLSIIDRVPDDVILGTNVCYFINPAEIDRNHDLAHLETAKLGILKAFYDGDDMAGTNPWLPVLPTNDPSRGWLMLGDESQFDVVVGDAEPGVFPQFGIDHLPISLVYAVNKLTNTEV